MRVPSLFSNFEQSLSGIRLPDFRKTRRAFAMLLSHKARPSHAVMFVLFTTLLASSGPVRAAMFQIEGSRTGINSSSFINAFLMSTSDPNGLTHAIAGNADQRNFWV